MQLVRFRTGHFALYHSPTRERQEVRFAATPSDPTKGPQPESAKPTPEGVEKPIGTDAQSPVLAGVQSLREKLLATTSIDEIPDNVLRSEPIYRSLVGVEIRDDETEDNLQDAKTTIETWRTDKNETAIAGRANAIKQLLKNPTVLLRSIKNLQLRVSQYDNANKMIGEIDTEDPELLKLVEVQVNEDSKKDRDDARIAVAKGAVTTHIVQKDWSAKLRVKLEAEYARKGIKTAPNIDWANLPPEAFADELVANFHRKQTVSGYAQRDLLEGKQVTSEDEAERLGAVMMKAQVETLRRSLDTIIRQRADELVRSYCDRYAKATGISADRLQRFANMTDNAVRRASSLLKSGNDPSRVKDGMNADVIKDLIQEDTFGLQRHGYSLVAMILKLKEIQSDIADPKERFMRDTKSTELDPEIYAQWRLDDIRAQTKELPEPEGIAAEAKQSQTELEEWTVETATRIEKLQQMGALPPGARGQTLKDCLGHIRHYAGTTAADWKNFRTSGPLPDVDGGCVTAMMFPDRHREILDSLLYVLENQELNALERQGAKDIDAKKESMPKDAPAILEIVLSTRTKVQELIPELDQRTTHKVTKAIGMPEQLRLLERDTVQGLKDVERRFQKTDVSGADIESAREHAASAAVTAERLQATIDTLKQISVRYADDITGPGEYDEQKHEIVINTKIEGRAAGVLEHERGHAILDVVVREMKLFPFLISRDLSRHREEHGSAFNEAFTKLKDVKLTDGSTPYQHLFEQLKPDELEEGLMEELRMRWADWKAEEEDSDVKKQEFHPVERDLFALLDQPGKTSSRPRTDAPPAFDAKSLGDFDKASASAGLNDDGTTLTTSPTEQQDTDRPSRIRRKNDVVGLMDDGQTLTDTTQQAAPGGEGGQQLELGQNIRDDLDGILRTIEETKTFNKAYKNDPEFSAYVPGLEEAVVNSTEWYEKLEKIFTDKDERQNWPPRPEENDRVKKLSSQLRNYCDVMHKYVHKLDTMKLDTSKEQKKSKGMFSTIQFWTIDDLVKFCTESWQDIQDMYKRKQDRRIKEVGETITGAMRNMSTGLPVLDRYINGLNAYHKRRYAGTEQEAANKWKEGMENEDSHTLLHYLHVTTNKDAVRGIISLLCDRGEMDWNDYGVWATLSSLGSYTIPKEACLRNDVLRDTWLRKVTSDIWVDKELYYHWKTTNDSKTKSGKGGFTDTADQLSNVHGMGSELEKQLKMMYEYKDAHHKGFTGTPPEDVKPHLYEEVLEYAMRNGKMTMEDKFYYLIHGINSGILGIERLRSLAGEKGEILMKFPFIDYFYGKNNTTDDIAKLARETRETGEGKQYKPGVRTTLFLYNKVARSESARARISKAISRVAETIDHEDIPFMITQLDYGTLNNLANVISGSRQKVTIEGWKNAYVGFNTNLKAFGELANLDEEGYDRVTKRDANRVAQTITSYIYMDNIITRNGTDTDGPTRPSLTKDQFDSGCPSGYGRKTGEYRTRMNHFLKALFSEKYLGKYQGLRATDELKSQDSKGKEKNVKLKDFAPIENPASVEKRNNDDPNMQYAVWKATESFSSTLQTLLQRDDAFETFKEFMRDYNDTIATPNTKLFNEGSDGEQFTRKQVVTIMQEQRKMSHDARHSNGNGGGHH